MKWKNSGVSLLVSLGISFLVLGISLSVITSAGKSLQRSSDLGRSTQVFFAAESGLEAAFFHHNARGQGVNFMGETAAQTIILADAASRVQWKIDGRTSSIIDVLKEGQKIQIPFFWDASTDPSQAPPFDSTGAFLPTSDQAGALSSPFALSFSRGSIPADFDFGTPENAVLIDWSVSKNIPLTGLQTLVPLQGLTGVCDAASSFICKDEFLNGGATLRSDQFISGEILPSGGLSDLVSFMGDTTAQEFSLSFQPLLPFLNTAGEKIEGIPFSLTSDTDFPKESYTILSEVSLGNFSKTMSVEVSEKTTIGAFDYVIFD